MANDIRKRVPSITSPIPSEAPQIRGNVPDFQDSFFDYGNGASPTSATATDVLPAPAAAASRPEGGSPAPAGQGQPPVREYRHPEELKMIARGIDEKVVKNVRDAVEGDGNDIVIDSSNGNITDAPPEQEPAPTAPGTGPVNPGITPSSTAPAQQQGERPQQVQAPEPRPQPQPLTPQETSQIMRGVESSGRYTQQERGEIYQSLRRIQRGEASDADYAQMQVLMNETPWQTRKYNDDGTLRGTNRSAGGSQADDAVNKMMRRASLKVYEGIQNQEFNSGKDLSDHITETTGIPGSVMLDYLARQEAMRARQNGIENPAALSGQYPVLSAIAKGAQQEMNDIELDQYKAKRDIDFDYSVSGGGSVGGGYITAAERGAYNYFAVREQMNPNDPETYGAYRRAAEKGELPYAYVDGEMRVGEEPDGDPWSSFQQSNDSNRVSRIRGSKAANIREYNETIGNKPISAKQYRKGLVEHLAGKHPDISRETAVREYGTLVDNATKEHVYGQMAAYHASVNSSATDVRANLGSVQESYGSGGLAKAFPASYLDDDGNLRIKGENSYVREVLARGGASEDLMREADLALSGMSNNQATRQLVTEIRNWHEGLTVLAAEEKAARGLADPNTAREIYGDSDTRFYTRSDSGAYVEDRVTKQVVSGSSDTMFVRSGKEYVPVLYGGRLSSDDARQLGEAIEIMNRSQVPEGDEGFYPKGFTQAIMDAFSFGRIRTDSYVSVAGTDVIEPVQMYDASKVVANLKAQGINRIPSRDEFVKSGQTFQNSLLYVSNTAYDALFAPEVTLTGMVVAPDEGTKLFEGINSVAGDLGKLKPAERTPDKVYGLVQDLPGPLKDTVMVSDAEFRQYLTNVINDTSETGKAIRKGLASEDAADRVRALSMAYAEVDRNMRAPIDAAALALVDFGERVIDNGAGFSSLALGPNVFADSILKRASQTTEPLSDEADANDISERLETVLDAVVAEYRELGGQPGNGSLYQARMLEALRPLYAQAQSNLETMVGQGMRVSNAQHAAVNAMRKAYDALNEDPYRNEIRTEIARIKYDIARPDGAIVGGVPVQFNRTEAEQVARYLANEYGINYEDIQPARKSAFGNVPLAATTSQLASGGIHIGNEEYYQVLQWREEAALYAKNK